MVALQDNCNKVLLFIVNWYTVTHKMQIVIAIVKVIVFVSIMHKEIEAAEMYIIGNDDRMSYPNIVAMEKNEYSNGTIGDPAYYRKICNSMCIVLHKTAVKQNLPTATTVSVPANLYLARMPYLEYVKGVDKVYASCSEFVELKIRTNYWQVDMDKITFDTYRLDKNGMPWIVKDGPICGSGSLIAKNVVLTATHLLETTAGVEYKASDIVCVFGYFNKKPDGSIYIHQTGMDEYYEVEKIVRFKKSDSYDASVLVLNRCAETPSRRPLQMYASADLNTKLKDRELFAISHPSGMELVYSGKGQTYVRSQSTCNQIPSSEFKYCLFHDLDICGGSSGAPIMVKPSEKNDFWNGKVIGVQSWGAYDYCFNKSTSKVEETRAPEGTQSCFTRAHNLSGVGSTSEYSSMICPDVNPKKPIYGGPNKTAGTCLVQVTVPGDASFVKVWSSQGDSKMTSGGKTVSFCVYGNYQIMMQVKHSFTYIQDGYVGGNCPDPCNW